jgi:flavin reductase (DIM6/NTAB) family NADH-FMN oxidoreductase RutF
MLESSAPSTDLPASFKAVMRGVAATVTIVTAADASRRHGMTATAMMSLSMDPPSLVVCINRATLLYDIMLSARRFCVNVLRHDQAELSAAFSGALSPEQRFQLGAWEQTDDGIGYLTDAQASVLCKRVAAVPFGTHTLFIGEVDQVNLGERIAPLVYQDARYCTPFHAVV